MSDSLWPYWIDAETGERFKLAMLAGLRTKEDSFATQGLYVFKSRDGHLNAAFPFEAMSDPNWLVQDTSFDWKKEAEEDA